MLYNRASADPQGRPWSERKRLVWWDNDQERWDSHDVVDFEPDKRPDYRADWSACPVGMEAIGGAESGPRGRIGLTLHLNIPKVT